MIEWSVNIFSTGTELNKFTFLIISCLDHGLALKSLDLDSTTPKKRADKVGSAVRQRITEDQF
jgi:hypothetical protein